MRLCNIKAKVCGGLSVRIGSRMTACAGLDRKSGLGGERGRESDANSTSAEPFLAW